MDNTTTTPEYLFESSWEVCNKVGGIYTVLSTKAHTLQQSFKDKLIFIGPDVWTDTNAPDFIEDDVLFADWKTYTKTTENLKVKVGRWNVPGTPPVILVDFKPFSTSKNNSPPSQRSSRHTPHLSAVPSPETTKPCMLIWMATTATRWPGS